MNYIAAVMNSCFQDAETTMGCLMGIVVGKGLKGLFTGSVPEYHIRSFIL
jgi:hypothetical protein